MVGEHPATTPGNVTVILNSGLVAPDLWGAVGRVSSVRAPVLAHLLERLPNLAGELDALGEAVDRFQHLAFGLREDDIHDV